MSNDFMMIIKQSKMHSLCSEGMSCNINKLSDESLEGWELLNRILSKAGVKVETCLDSR